MKKLLSLLSVLTISGTAIPTTIAASPYQKEEIKIENSDINFQTNNLENLNREKRQNNNFLKDLNLKILDSDLNANNYFENLSEIIFNLEQNDIIRSIRPQSQIGGYSTPEFYFINSIPICSYFIISVKIDSVENNINLIFRSSDFYLQGFYYNRIYYYFSDSSLTNYRNITNDNNIINNSINLDFRSDYTSLQRVASSSGGRWSDEVSINWEGIRNAFFQLSNIDNLINNRQQNIIAASLIRVILSTAESLRFRQVQNLITRSVQYSNVTWNSFRYLITNWDGFTRNAVEHFNTHGHLIDFPNLHQFRIFTSRLSEIMNLCFLNQRWNARRISDVTDYCFSPKDKVIYWNSDKSNLEINSNWWSGENHYFTKDFEIGYYDPSLYYNKGEILGDTSNTRVSWGNKSYYDNSSLESVFQIKNNDSNKYYYQIGIYKQEGLTHIEGIQSFNFYFKKNIDKYYLTLEVLQRATCGGGCIQGGALFLNFGKGIKLYK